jgi:DNA phosphorothioation-associated putative methyltransferase
MPEVIARHKTAISRTEPSRPIKLALVDGLLSQDRTFFDYGCGLGDDLRLLHAAGLHGKGWDPVHRPLGELEKAAVVNIGYVVNVIEDARERQDALRRAWALAEQVLIVSARLTPDSRALGETQDFADGLLTSRGTFQKFYEQQELRNWIDQTLGVASVPAAPGVFYVFREGEARAAFVAARYHRHAAAPRFTRSADLYQQHEELLAPLMAFVGQRGRLPADDEIANAQELREVFGSIRKAFRIILRVTDEERWKQVAKDRAEDLLIYLALARFDQRAQFGKLPRPLQRDVKEFFSAYTSACEEADELLFSLGQPGVVDAACRNASIGKVLPEALYVHESALESMPPLLRLFEGCARAYIGRVDGANVIKLSRFEFKVSYLSYPEFYADPHPALTASVRVDLQTFRVKSRDFTGYSNPPILHRKEALLTNQNPLHSKFSRLTKMEEEKGLYEETSRIGTRDGWNELLEAKGYTYRGHRLVKAPASAAKK